MRGLRWAAMPLCAVLALGACSPALDWRESQLPEAGLIMAFPCRPDRHERALQLAEQAVKLSMQVCEAQDLVFAVSAAQVSEPAQVGPALLALRTAFAANLGDARAQPLSAAPVPGATPQSAAGRWGLKGDGPDRVPRFAEVQVFSRGTWVVQATVLSRAALPELASRPFFEGLRFAL